MKANWKGAAVQNTISKSYRESLYTLSGKELAAAFEREHRSAKLALIREEAERRTCIERDC